MVLTSNHILIIKKLFSSRKAQSKSSLLSLGLTAKEFDKEIPPLIEDGVIKKTTKGYVLQFHTHGTREYLRMIHEKELSQQENHLLWAQEIKKLKAHALAALFYHESKIHLLLIAEEDQKKALKKDLGDLQLFTQQLFDPLLLSPEEFLLALDDKNHKVHNWLAQGTVSFGLNELCHLLS